MSPAFDRKLPDGWFPSDPEQAARFHAELGRELPPGHMLYGVPVEVVAHREGTDDILCRHVEDNNRLTVIHLTWLMREEIGPDHPTVEVDGDIDDFYAYERRFGIDCLPCMTPTPIDVLARIKEGSLLPPAVIAALDHDAILDARDRDAEFESQWMRCYKQVEDLWRCADIKQELNTLKDDVCRESFLSVSRATAQHEIASYVSDDFDLIIRGAMLGLNDNFLSCLWEAYNRDEIPTPKTSK